MADLVDLTGQTFFKLRVIKRNPDNAKNGEARWDCECVCGKTTTVTGCSLRSGSSNSCGCYHTEVVRQTIKNAHAANKIENNVRDRPEYSIWTAMRDRCNNENNSSYHNYGGRGISVCDRWGGSSGFENFLADMGPRPSDQHSIDRIDNDGNYESNNCQWTTKTAQANNRRCCIFHSYKGGLFTAAEIARDVDVPYKALFYRLSVGQTVDHAIEAIKNKRKAK